MFRRSSSSFCHAAAQAAAAATAKQSGTIYLHNAEPVLTDAGATPDRFSFARRYEHLRAERGTALSSEPYEALMSNLKHYDDLLRTYSVKQTEMERAKRAARMCGLEMTNDPFAKVKAGLTSESQ